MPLVHISLIATRSLVKQQMNKQTSLTSEVTSVGVSTQIDCFFGVFLKFFVNPVGAVGDDTMDGNAPTDELAQDEEYEIPAAENHIKKNTDGIKQSDALIQDEEYEVPANEVVKSEVTELLEEDEPEEYDGIVFFGYHMALLDNFEKFLFKAMIIQ